MESPNITSEVSSLVTKLNPKDKELIKMQCEIQGATSLPEVEGFTKAYAYAKDFAHSESLLNLTPENVLSLVDKLINYTEPNKNSNGYRKIPVTFSNGTRGLNPALIPEQMEKWAEAFVYSNQDEITLYKRFEEIHPFVDGNGRVGDLLWKINVKRKGNAWPEELPPNVFGEEKKSQTNTSAFGEIEK